MKASVPMTRNVTVVPPELSLAAAWAIMERKHIRHLPVTRAGALHGIVSDRDILARSKLRDDGSLDIPAGIVATAMTPAPITAEPDTSVSELVHVMTERKIDAVPIVRGLRLLGLVTSTDLLLLLLDFERARPMPFEFQLEEVALEVA